VNAFDRARPPALAHCGEFPELTAAVVAALEAADYKAAMLMSIVTFTRPSPTDGGSSISMAVWAAGDSHRYSSRNPQNVFHRVFCLRPHPRRKNEVLVGCRDLPGRQDQDHFCPPGTGRGGRDL
jgi:hypothetical protein